MLILPLKAVLNKAIILIPIGVLLFNYATSGFAQDFNLFETVEVTDNPQATEQRPGRESRVLSAKPEFTLVGTSRIGDSYAVILADLNGEKLVIRTAPDVNVSVPEYGDFQIAITSNGKVSLQHPDSVPCVDYPESGVRCNSANNIAELTLPNNPPVASSQQAAQLAATTFEGQAAEVIEENPQNPFAIMRARALNGDDLDNPAIAPQGVDDDSRFVPRRIDPSEVPPGMRVVSTPFGDRLVEQ